VPAYGAGWTLYDNYGNELYATVGVYEPGSNTPAYAQTTYQLFNGNSVTLPGTNTAISCTATAPAPVLPCATISAGGVVTQLTYDSAGDLTSTSTPDGNGSELATTTYSYDGDGEQVSTIGPDGNLAGANTGNYTTTTAYNADGRQTSVSDGGGSGHTVTPRTTTYGYDANGNQTTVQDARGYTSTIGYNADDRAVLVTDADGNTTLTCYDGDGNLAQSVPPAGVAANSLTPASCPAAYPAGYNPDTSQLATDATMATFNALGQKTQEFTPLPAGQTGPHPYETTTYAYDSDGNLLQVTVPPATTGGPNQVITSTYNDAGKLATQTTGSGSAASTVSYCYDPSGRTTSVVYADGNASGVAPCNTNPTSYPWIVDPHAYPAQGAAQTTYSYDAADELVSVTRPGTAAAPNGMTTTFTYAPNGDELTSTNPDGVTATMTYTPGGQEASVSYSGSPGLSASYSYDADGNMTAMTDATGSSSYVYDAFGELTSSTNGAGQTVGHGYDADGDTTSVTYPLPSAATWASTDTVNYNYDHAGLLTGVTDFNGNQITVGSTADGLPNSLALGSTGDTITTSYDPTDTPSAITLKNSSATLQSFGYSYGPAGTILNEADNPGSAQSPTYTYDNRGRVTSMTPGTGTALNYGFDASSNLTTLPTGATGSYDNAGELSTATLSGTATSYAYDAAGNRLTAKQGSTTIASGTWDGTSDLTGYSNAAAAMSGAVYSDTGMRASATFTPSGEGPVTENYVWNGDNLLMDSGNAYIYLSGHAPAEQVNLATGAITYLNTDSLGSVRGTVNGSGALTGTTSYDAWGNPQTTGGLTATTPFGYAGGYTDPTGLLYLINRYYDPATGQFTSLDPAVDQTLQPYAYTGGNPVSSSDPTGLCTNGPCGGGSGVPSQRYLVARDFIYDEIENNMLTSNTFWDMWSYLQVYYAYRHSHNPFKKALAYADFWTAAGELVAKVCEGCAWDFKVQLGPYMSNGGKYGIQGESGELNYYTRVTKKRQIYYNVWANISYGYVGWEAGFSSWFLQNGAEAIGIILGTNTEGNYLERQMGINMGHSVSDFYNLTDGSIDTAIRTGLNQLSNYCDALPFPFTRKQYVKRGCKSASNW